MTRITLYVCIIAVSGSSPSVRTLEDEHLEGLSGLFIKGRMITVSIEFVYKEVTSESTTAKSKGKRKSATEAQKLERAAAAGLWTRVYEH